MGISDESGGELYMADFHIKPLVFEFVLTSSLTYPLLVNVIYPQN